MFVTLPVALEAVCTVTPPGESDGSASAPRPRLRFRMGGNQKITKVMSRIDVNNMSETLA